MTKRFLLFALVAVFLACAEDAGERMGSIRAAEVNDRLVPGDEWAKVSDPAALGWSMPRLEEAKEYFESRGFSAVFIVHNGAVVAEWGDTAKPFNLRSMRKAILGALYGQQVERGAIRLDARLAELGIDENTPLTAAEKQARVSDLLSSSSGITLPAAWDAPGDEKPARGSVPRGKFLYNNWDFNALGTIYEKAAGRSLFDAAIDEIAKPTGMRDFTREQTSYRKEDVSRHPAYVMHMSARDLARFGLLYLRGGAWNGKQIIPKSWIEQSTRARVTTDRDGESYGYLWWVRRDDAEWGRGGFSSTGLGGQVLWIDPPRKVVVVILTDTRRLWLQRVLKTQVTGRERTELLRRILAAAP